MTPKPPKVPNPPRRSPLRPARDLTVRSDESIGRPEDIGRLVPPAAESGPFLCARCRAGDHCRGDETCMCKCGKSTRVTVNLDAATYSQLNHWLNRVTVEVNPDARRISLAQALRAMIRTAILDPSIAEVVIDVLRRENES